MRERQRQMDLFRILSRYIRVQDYHEPPPLSSLTLFKQTQIKQKERKLIEENGIPPKNNKLIIWKFQT